MPVGEAATRAAAAEALLIAADSMAGASDSETLRQLVVSMDGVLAGECHLLAQSQIKGCCYVFGERGG